MKLVIKFPTRQRPDKFFEVLNKYYEYLRDDNFEFIVSCDVDDGSMNNASVIAKLQSYPYLRYYFSNNTSKIEAINNNITSNDFDVLLLASDDMIPVTPGYDVIIKNMMLQHFPDTDGVLWFNDGFQGSRLNTLVILGKEYYKRFNYIYHPAYKSLYCDAEFTDVSVSIGKVQYFNEPIIKHAQYSIVNESPDELYKRNDSLANRDQEVYVKRKQQGFKHA